jgi:hypothetical protein
MLASGRPIAALFQDDGGRIVAPDVILVSRLDGGHLAANPPREVCPPVTLREHSTMVNGEHLQLNLSLHLSVVIPGGERDDRLTLAAFEMTRIGRNHGYAAGRERCGPGSVHLLAHPHQQFAPDYVEPLVHVVPVRLQPGAVRELEHHGERSRLVGSPSAMAVETPFVPLRQFRVSSGTITWC